MSDIIMQFESRKEFRKWLDEHCLLQKQMPDGKRE